MRYNLITSREKKELSISEMSKILKISERMYRYIESGERTGSYKLWDSLEDLFKIPQRRLREIEKKSDDKSDT